MTQKLMREWKKVFATDISYIVYELKELTKAPAMVILDGPLGVGKTTFCQQFIGLEDVTSPSYSLINEHGQNLHADFYRLEKPEDVLALDIPLHLEGKQYFLAEWGVKFSRRLMRELPEAWSGYLLEISFSKAGQQSELIPRNFTLSSLSDD